MEFAFQEFMWRSVKGILDMKVSNVKSFALQPNVKNLETGMSILGPLSLMRTNILF